MGVQDKMRKIGGLVARLSEANALLASAGGTIERDSEYARRAVFVQAASVCQRRLITIGEHEYLSYECAPCLLWVSIQNGFVSVWSRMNGQCATYAQ